MNAEELFNEIRTDTADSILSQLKWLFFKKKIKEVTDKDNTVLNRIEKRIMIDDFIANFNKELPEAELIYYKRELPRWIKMENVDFDFDACGIDFFDTTISSTRFYATNNIWELLRYFNNVMPEWNTEFRTLCAENQRKIDKLARKQLIDESSKQNVVENYLKFKVIDTTIMNRKLLPIMYKSVVGALKNVGKSEYERLLDGYKIDFSRVFDRPSRIILDFNIGHNFCIGLYSPEILLEIDRRIPQWIEEGKELEREFDKREKIKQINENSTKVLVKNKMRELGCEYRFADKDKGQSYYYKQSEKPKEYELAIKLQKGRKLVVTIPSANLDRVRKILDSLSASINAINSVPMNHRIKSQRVGNEVWLKE